MKVNTVLFDMDGVLLNSTDMWFRNFNSCLGHFKFDRISRSEFLREVLDKGGIVRGVVEKYFPGMDFVRFNSFYFRNVERYVGSCKVMIGAKRTLDRLKRKGFKIGVVTNTYRKPAMSMLRRGGLLRRINILVGGDDVKNPKPSPEAIQKGYRRLLVGKARCVYVGDADSDRIAARRAGIKFVGFKRGGDYRIRRLGGLLRILKKLNK